MPVADLRRFLGALCAASAPRSWPSLVLLGLVMASPKVAIKARVLVDLKELGSYGKMLDPTAQIQVAVDWFCDKAAAACGRDVVFHSLQACVSEDKMDARKGSSLDSEIISEGTVQSLRLNVTTVFKHTVVTPFSGGVTMY